MRADSFTCLKSCLPVPAGDVMNSSDSHALPAARRVLIAGATGYIGSRLVPVLLGRGHAVRAFVRAGNRLLPAGCEVVSGNALDESSYTAAARGMDTLVHLVGVAHPSPSKAALFESVDLASARVAAQAAMAAGVSQIVYVSVARPAPVMHAYVEARRRGDPMHVFAAVVRTRPGSLLAAGNAAPVRVPRVIARNALHRASTRAAPNRHNASLLDARDRKSDSRVPNVGCAYDAPARVSAMRPRQWQPPNRRICPEDCENP
jgi:hypothetical protein